MQNLVQDYEPRPLPPQQHYYPPLHQQLTSSSIAHSIVQQGGQDTDDDDDSISTPKAGKRSGRRKIKIEYIEDKSRRHITFSKRKAGIMKKAYELSTLTGTQVLLLVVSETGLVYTFTTPKLQPLVTKPEGKNLIQACLNAPDSNETVSLSHSSAYPASDPYAPLPSYPQDHHHQSSYNSPPTPYPTYSDTNQAYPASTSYPSTTRHPSYLHSQATRPPY
ncbi:hypothetical protein [Absidia glauca]|uniref:MADS-box domain-containing protein n=1 Tax=Absidia glauca TaxID=4829 RepID=A0A168Q482_ABSGL|nr:hypothetical protein [Absidia glauca]